jgi:hypothetical protein
VGGGAAAAPRDPPSPAMMVPNNAAASGAAHSTVGLLLLIYAHTHGHAYASLPLVLVSTFGGVVQSDDDDINKQQRQQQQQQQRRLLPPPEPLVRFSSMTYADFHGLQFLPLPYTGGTNASLGKTWVFGVSCCNSSVSSHHFFTEAKIKAASQAYAVSGGAPLLTQGLECSGCDSTAHNLRVENVSSCIGEWGYEFHEFSERNPQFAAQPCVNLTMATKLSNQIAPTDRHEALQWMNAYYDCRKRTGAQQAHGRPAGLMDLIGHYFYSVRSMRGGFSWLGGSVEFVNLMRTCLV